MVLDVVCIFTFFIYELYVVLLKRDQESGVGVAFGNEQVREYVLWTDRFTAQWGVLFHATTQDKIKRLSPR